MSAFTPVPSHLASPGGIPELFRTANLEDDVTLVFGEGRLLQRIRAANQRLLEDTARIRSSADLGDLALAFVGPKNSGKTWLAKSLVRNSDLQAQMPCGLLSQESTREFFLLLPPTAREDGSWEGRVVRTKSGDLADLGRPYALLDAPGLDEMHLDRRESARKALLACPFQVLVVDAERREAASIVRYLREAEGAVVLPVLRVTGMGDKWGTPANQAWEEWEEEARAWTYTLKTAVPGSQFLDPFLLGDSPDPQTGPSPACVTAFLETLRGAFRELEPGHLLLERKIDHRLALHGKEIRVILHDPGVRLHPLLEEINRLETDLPVRLLDRFLGTNAQVEARLRLQLRNQAVGDIPTSWFPFRQALGLLSLTAGAWDRLLLSGFGSLVSLVQVGRTAWQNQQEQRGQSDWRAHGLEKGLQALAREECAPLYRRLLEVTDHCSAAETGSPRRTSPQTVPDVRLTGTESLRLFWDRKLETSLSPLAPGGMTKVLVGLLLGVGLFWAHLSAPLLSLYTRFYQAWLAFFQEGVPFPWESFGVNFAAGLFWSLLVAGIPLLIIAGLYLALATRRGRIRPLAAHLRGEFLAGVRQRLDQGSVVLQIDDERVHAVRRLFGK